MVNEQPTFKGIPIVFKESLNAPDTNFYFVPIPTGWKAKVRKHKDGTLSLPPFDEWLPTSK